MRANKIFLLILILTIGSALEVAWRVRERVDFGPLACRVLGHRPETPSFSFENESVRELPAGTAVRIDNSFGGVSVVPGKPGEIRVGLRTVAFMETEAQARAVADTVKVRFESQGETLKVSTNRSELEHSSGDFETHLQINVTPGTRIVVRNEHGPVTASEVTDADIETSYDTLRVEKVAGSATLKSSHGDITAQTVAGPLTLSSRWGDIEAADIGGTVRVDARNGAANLRRVGAVTAELQQAELTAEVVKGTLEVRGERSQVSAESVEGDAEVETSYREVRLARVHGNARVRSQHAEVNLENVTGSVSAETSYANVTVVDVKGKTEVSVEHGGVHGTSLRGGAHLNASGDEVVLDGFEGAVVIQSRRGNVTLNPDTPLIEELQASSENGEVELTVPAGSRFDLTASSEGGEVRADVPDLDIAESSPVMVKGRVGGGGKRVTLSASHGEVRIHSKEAEKKGDHE